MRPIVSILKSGKVKLLKDYTVSMGLVYFKLKKGFISDGASIPRVFAFFGDAFDGNTLNGALIHDALYATKGEVKINNILSKLPRKNTDAIFYDIMKHDGTPLWQRCIYYIGVRLGGWLPFNYGRKKDHREVISIKVIC